jgi:NADPH:quinone reductase-like Zn-dependent oxidoreductase
MIYATRDERQELVRMVADGKLKVLVDSVWSFKNVLGGYDILWFGRARGNIIVKVDE